MASEPNVQDGRLALVLNNVLINVDLPRPDDPKCKIKVDIKLKIHNQASTSVLIHSLCYKSNKKSTYCQISEQNDITSWGG